MVTVVKLDDEDDEDVTAAAVLRGNRAPIAEESAAEGPFSSEVAAPPPNALS